MSEQQTAAHPPIETTTVQVLVTMTVAPQAGQTLEEASTQMTQLFREYLTLEDSVFRSDYGATVDEIVAHRSDPDGVDEPTWGGYEGPFVTTTVVQAIEPARSED